MSALLKKPRKWVFSSGLVAPEWAWSHKELIAAYPMWDKQGTRIYDVSPFRRSAPFTNTPTWVTERYGAALEFTEDGSEYALAELSGLGLPLASSTATDWKFSIIVTGVKIVNTATGKGIIQIANSISDGTPFLLIQNEQSSQLRFLFNNAFIFIITVDADAIHTVALTYDGVTIKIYINGELVDSSARGVAFASADNDLWIGNGSNESFGGRIGGVLLWKRTLTDLDILKISRDPFGPFRMVDEIPVIGLSVVFTSANLALHHSGASDIGGAIGAVLTDDQLNNLWDDVSSGDASSGDTEYRCSYVKNTHGSLSVANVKVEIDTDPTESNFEIALGAAGKNGTETAVADEDTAPATPTFGTTPLTIGTLAAGDFYPIWIKRIVSAGAGAATPDSGVLNILGDDPN